MHALLTLMLLTQSAWAPAAPALAVDTLRPPGGPAVLWQRAPSPLIALRLSAPLPPGLPAGAAELLQELARPAAAERAERFGARLSMRVERDQAVIAVTGPAAAFDALVGVLRVAAGEPDLSVSTLRAGRARAEDRVLAELEQPEPRLRALLAARLAGARATGPAATLLEPETIRTLRARIYHPAALTVVLVGELPPEVVASAFAGWGGGPLGRPVAGDLAPGRAPPLPAAQAHHAWAALAYPAAGADPGTVAVAAALVERRVRAAGLRAGVAEAWWTPAGPMLVLLGGAAPGDPAVAGAARITEFPEGTAGAAAAPLPRYLRRLVAEAAALAGPPAVRDAAAALRRAVLLEARTPAGRADVIARLSDRGGAEAFLAALDAVRLEEVRDLLGAALSAPALFVEVRP